MSYIVDDTSLAEAQPVELYTVTGPTATYRYTSHFADVIYDGETYAAVEMTRGSLRIDSAENPPIWSFELPFDAPFVQDYALSEVAPRTASLAVRRYHLGSGPAAGIEYLSGTLASISLQGRVATVEVLSAAEQLTQPVPSVHWQGQCQHLLYGPYCRALEIQFQVPFATVDTVTSGQVEIIVSNVNGIPALGGASTPTDYLADGYIRRVVDGETRLILSNNGAGNTRLTLDRPFPALEVGDAVQISAGCDHTVATCHEKFSNAENYGGHPVIPAINLFNAYDQVS